MKKTLEVCIDSLASARAAISGGADRLELCSSLSIGGLTPYIELLQQIRKESNIEIRSMIRPRSGDFLYTNDEIELMLMQIENLRKAGSSGFVIGCLNADGTLDTRNMKKLIDVANGLPITLHRAIDVSKDLLETYKTAKTLEIDTVLTSGGENNCTKGKENIGKLLSLQEEINGPQILIGAGVNADVITDFKNTFNNAICFHMSGKSDIESKMKFRRENIPMGHPAFDEWHISVSDTEKIKKARLALYK